MLCIANDDNDDVDESNSSHERKQRARIRANLHRRRHLTMNCLYGADTEAVEKTKVIFGFAAILIVAVVAVSSAKVLSSAHSGRIACAKYF